MDMDTAWPAYLVGGFLGFLGLELYAKLTGKPTLTQWIRRRVGAQPMHWRYWIFAPLGGALLAWLWFHLFTRWL